MNMKSLISIIHEWRPHYKKFNHCILQKISYSFIVLKSIKIQAGKMTPNRGAQDELRVTGTVQPLLKHWRLR